MPESTGKKGASTPVLRLVATFLTNRTMTVRVGQTWSEPRAVCGGSPQGSILGVFLFNPTIDDLEEGCEDLIDTSPELESVNESQGDQDWSTDDENPPEIALSTPIRGSNVLARVNEFLPAASPVLPLHGLTGKKKKEVPSQAKFLWRAITNGA